VRKRHHQHQTMKTNKSYTKRIKVTRTGKLVARNQPNLRIRGMILTHGVLLGQRPWFRPRGGNFFPDGYGLLTGAWVASHSRTSTPRDPKIG
jgi:hypothetical protein